MSPTFEHDKDSRFLGRLVTVLTEEFELPLIPGGSTTLRRRLRRRGIEADECFWIAHAPRMAGRARLDLRSDPPPDLAIEVDVTHRSLDRMGIYAALRVPEVWRVNGDQLTFYVLQPDGIYASAGVSPTFPLVSPDDLLPFLQQARQASDHNVVAQRFRARVCERRCGRSPAKSFVLAARRCWCRHRSRWKLLASRADGTRHGHRSFHRGEVRLDLGQANALAEIAETFAGPAGLLEEEERSAEHVR